MPALFVQVSVKLTIVLLAAWLLTRAMARSSAAARHLVWTVAIVAALLLPLIHVTVPRWHLPLLPAPAAAAVVAAVAPEPERAPIPAEDWQIEAGVTGVAPAPAASLAAVDSRPAFPPATEIGRMAVAMAVWVAGLAIALARLAAGLAWVSRITREAVDVDDMRWTSALDDLVAAFGITSPVALKFSPEAAIPVTCGIRTPTILLPPDAAGWVEERRDVVLLHELAHIARRDCLVQTLARLACAVHWFNPLVHLAAVRLRAEQERASDDLVLAAGANAPMYADHLFELARTARTERDPTCAAVAMARPSQIEGRVMDILDDRRNRRPPVRRVRTALAASAAVLMLPLGALHLTAAAGSRLPDAAQVVPAGERDAVSVALDVQEAPPALPAPLDVQRDDQPPDAVVRAARQISDGRPGVDVDVSIDVDDPDPDPDPDSSPWPVPNPWPWGPDFAGQLGLKGADSVQAKSQPGSQDTAVSDETRRRVADALLPALNDEDEAVREQALAALAGMRDPRAIPGLLKALRDPSAQVRGQALSGLAQFDTPEATEGVLSALEDQSADVRQRAARLMGLLGARGRLNDPKFVALLAGLLKDAAPEVRMQAIVALGRLRRSDAVPSLLPMLNDANAEVREQAAVALGTIADPAAIDALTAALKDAEPDVRERAAGALGQIARGQRRANPGVNVPPLPPMPPAPPRPPQVYLDTDAINDAVQQARESLQRDLPRLRLQLQEFGWPRLELRQIRKTVGDAARAVTVRAAGDQSLIWSP